MSKSNDRGFPVHVVADGWSGAVVAGAFRALGHECRLWVSERLSADPLFVSVGNGEVRSKAGQIFGEALARSVWSHSEANEIRARAFFGQHQVATWDQGLFRDGVPGRETGLAFSGEALRALMPQAQSFRRLLGVSAVGKLEFEVALETASGTESIRSPLWIVATEEFDRSAVPWLFDKRIPVSLSSFVFHQPQSWAGTVRLFNGGADYGISDGSKLRLGSYRNLYEDRGVGIHTEIDPRTRENVLRYFATRGWVQGEPLAEHLSVESVSCDGLPLIGPLPGMTGVIFLTAFAARGPCFLFEAAHQVARAVLQGSELEADVFGSRRLL